LRRDPATGDRTPGGAGGFIAEVIEDHLAEGLRKAGMQMKAK
jgi:hypothetical protein